MMLSYYRVYERVCLCVFVLNRSTWKLSLVYFPNVMWVVVNNEINNSQNGQRDSQVDLPAWVFIYLTFITDEPRVTSFTGSRHIRISNQNASRKRNSMSMNTRSLWENHMDFTCDLERQHASTCEKDDLMWNKYDNATFERRWKLRCKIFSVTFDIKGHNLHSFNQSWSPIIFCLAHILFQG